MKQYAILFLALASTACMGVKVDELSLKQTIREQAVTKTLKKLISDVYGIDNKKQLDTEFHGQCEHFKLQEQDYQRQLLCEILAKEENKDYGDYLDTLKDGRYSKYSNVIFE